MSVDENAGLVTVGLPVTGTDVDVGQTLTYSLGLSGNTNQSEVCENPTTRPFTLVPEATRT